MYGSETWAPRKAEQDLLQCIECSDEMEAKLARSNSDENVEMDDENKEN